MKTDNEHANALKKGEQKGQVHMETVEKNHEGFSAEEQFRAKMARQLPHKTGAQCIENFEHAVQFNVIEDCPVVLEDIENVMKICGKDLADVKGKTPREQPRKVVSDSTDTPKEI